jgi:hypothetical protein
MMFHIGQKVVCIRIFTTRPVKGEKTPVKGSVYTVRGIMEEGEFAAVFLEEIVNPEVCTHAGVRERGFDITAFKPVQEKKTDISIFNEILNKVNNSVKEKV